MKSSTRISRLSRHNGYSRGNTTITLVIVAVVAAVAIYFGWSMVNSIFTGSSDEVVQWQFTSVERKPFQHVVIEQGDIESSSNVEVDCNVRSRNSSGTQIIWVITEGSRVIDPTLATVSGMVTSISERVGDSCTITVEIEDGTKVDHQVTFGGSREVMVKVGEEVSSGTKLAGDKLVELDASALEDEENRQQIAVNQAVSAVISANASVEKAVIARKEYLQGIFKQEVQLILSEILVGEENVSRAKDNYRFSTRLAAQGFLTEQQLKADEFAVQKSQIDLDLANSRLETLEEITKQKMLVGFDSDIETAKASQDTAVKNQAEEVSELELIRQQIVNCMIFAPAGGQVVYANKQSSRSGSEFIVEPGTMVRERQTIIYLPDTNKMQVKAKVNEGRIAFVRVGQSVKIKVGALEGQELDGIVAKVNPYAETSSWFSTGVKEFAAYIRIIDPPATIRTGMSAEVSISVKSEDNALQVPVQVLHEDSTEFYCLVRTDSSENTFTEASGRKIYIEVRELEFDTSNEKTLVVVGGLEEKEKVVRNPRLHEDILNRLVYQYRANWLLEQLDANKDNLLSLNELAANKFGTVLETIIDPIMVVDSVEEGEEKGDGKLNREELAVFVEDGERYVNFKKQYLLAAGAQQLIKNTSEKDELDEADFDKLAAEVKAGSEAGQSLKLMIDKYKQYKIKESMIRAIGQVSFADLDQNSNKTVGWYELNRFLQTATYVNDSAKPRGGANVAQGAGGARAAGGAAGGAGGGAGGGAAGGAAGGAGGGAGGGNIDPSRIVGFMMDRLDTDKNGELSKEEIDASSDPERTRASDTDGDGKITKAEMLESIKKRMAAGGGGGARPGGGGGGQ